MLDIYDIILVKKNLAFMEIELEIEYMQFFERIVIDSCWTSLKHHDMC